MDWNASNPTLWLLTLVVGIFVWYILKLISFYRNYPPGPWGLPILGHLLFLGINPGKTLIEWGRIYGPIMSIRMGTFPTIVLNDVKLIREAFTSSSFSGRPTLNCFESSGNSLGFGSGPLVQEQRQFVIKQLKELGMDSRRMDESIKEELVDVLEDLRQKSGKTLKFGGNDLYFSIPILNAIWGIFMGVRFKHDDKRMLELGKSACDFFETAGLHATLTVFVPWIQKLFPSLSGSKKQNAGGREVYNFVEADFNQSIPNNMYPYVAGDILLGSIDTTSKTLNWFLVYMLRYPEVYERLYQEVDSVVGSSRLPSLTDRPNLNYAEAVISEVLRYASFTPIGNFHRATHDVTFRGYKIPKDTIIIGNMYGVHYDPNLWDKPELFQPTRFLDDQGKFVKSENLISFSMGKRNCVGQVLARDQLLLYTTSIVQKFKLSCPNPDGPSEDGVPSIQMAPLPFEIIFTARH